MCGIAGLARPLPATDARRRVTTMLDAMVHRGPDDEGIESVTTENATVVLGNRRLAIRDLSPHGHQPMRDPATGVVLVYNGEVYNAEALRAELEASGVRFRGSSDTEVVLQAYASWGTRGIARLSGMFAMAFWDPRTGELVLARDGVGIKPLYYAHDGPRFGFASEVGPLAAGLDVPMDVDRTALAGYLAYGSVQEPRTILVGVRSVPPGHRLTFRPADGTVAMERFWELPARARPWGDAASEATLRISGAVKSHLVADVPVGVFLSSGLDSTTVAGWAGRHSPGRIQAFTVTLPGAGALDEGPVAADAARRNGLVHHPLSVDESTALEWTGQALEAMDQPSMDGFNTYLVSRRVHDEGITAALSGQGGDEVFGGYTTFRSVPSAARWLGRLRWLPTPLRRILMSVFVSRGTAEARQKARELASGPADLRQVYLRHRRVVSDADLRLLGFGPELDQLGPALQPPEDEPPRMDPRDSVDAVGRLELHYYLRNTLLRDGDVFGMANSLEIRVPLLDRGLVEWAFSLPGRVRLPARGPSKPLIRAAGSEFFAPRQAQMPKRGFVLPWESWLRGPLRSLALDRLEALRKSGLVEPAGVDAILRRFEQDPASGTWSRLWTLIVLGAWWQRAHRPRPTFQAARTAKVAA